MMKGTLFAVALAAAASNAFSQGFFDQSAVYGGLGYAKHSFDDDGQLSGTNLDDEDNGLHAFGGYRFNKYLAAELSVRDLGEYKARGAGFTYSSEFSAITIGAVGFLPLGDRFSLYGRVGAGGVSLDEKLIGNGLRISDDDSGSTVTLGAGVEFRPFGTDGLAMRLGWESHFFTVETEYLVTVGNVSYWVEDDFDQRIDSFGLDIAWYFTL